jgi:hypothetical protein
VKGRGRGERLHPVDLSVLSPGGDANPDVLKPRVHDVYARVRDCAECADNQGCDAKLPEWSLHAMKNRGHAPEFPCIALNAP